MNAETPDLNLDAAALYREEVFSDQRVGSLRRLTPVLADGSDDPDRPVQYIGSAQLYTPAGPLPLNFPIEAADLTDAVAKFGEQAQIALDQTMEELKEMRRQQSSSIVVPQTDPGGGMPGGGKIQMP